MYIYMHIYMCSHNRFSLGPKRHMMYPYLGPGMEFRVRGRSWKIRNWRRGAQRGQDGLMKEATLNDIWIAIVV